MHVCLTEFFFLLKVLEFLVSFTLLGLDICISEINTDVLDFGVQLILKCWSEVKHCSC